MRPERRDAGWVSPPVARGHASARVLGAGSAVLSHQLLQLRSGLRCFISNLAQDGHRLRRDGLFPAAFGGLGLFFESGGHLFGLGASRVGYGSKPAEGQGHVTRKWCGRRGGAAAPVGGRWILAASPAADAGDDQQHGNRSCQDEEGLIQGEAGGRESSEEGNAGGNEQAARLRGAAICRLVPSSQGH